MEVFLMVKRQNQTIFLDGHEATTIGEVKRMIEGILKRPAQDQQLFKDGVELDDKKTLADCELTIATAKAQAPPVLGLCFKMENGEFEPLEITPLSQPPELPEELKNQEGQGNAGDN